MPVDLSAVRLVATDLDGTLLDPAGEVSVRAAAAVRAVQAAGIPVLAVTGRPPQALWPIAEAAGLGPIAVCSNGAVVVDVTTRQVMSTSALRAHDAVGLVDVIRAAVPGILLAVDHLDRFVHERGFFSGPVDWQERLEEVDDIRAEVVEQGCVKLIGRVPGTAAVELIAALECHVAEGGSLTTSGLDWVDIGPPGVSKAFALEAICAELGIGRAAVLALGDNHNDLPLLAWAGQVAVPANAVPEAHALAGRVLASNAHDGAAQMLEELASLRSDGR